MAGAETGPILAPGQSCGARPVLRRHGGTEMQALLSTLRQRARALKAETLALYLVARDPRVPWYARVLVAGIVAYALSPIDLIPDFVPILGYLDDLIIVPLG